MSSKRSQGGGLRSKSRIVSQQREVLPGAVEEETVEGLEAMEEVRSPSVPRPDIDSDDEMTVPPLSSLVIPFTSTRPSS